MTRPTPVTSIDAGTNAISDVLGGARVAVDDSLRQRLGEVCAQVTDDPQGRAEAAPGLVAALDRVGSGGRLPARPALVARPTDTDQVSAVLAPSVTKPGFRSPPAGGRSGCGGMVSLFGGVALDLCGLAGFGEVDVDLAGRRHTCRYVRARRGEGAPRRPWTHPRTLATVDRPFDGGRLAGL